MSVCILCIAFPCCLKILIEFLQECAHCHKLGASVACDASIIIGRKLDKCSKFYHYKCLSLASCVQFTLDIGMLCLEHATQIESIPHLEIKYHRMIACSKCNLSSNLSQILFCSRCGIRLHASCVEAPAPQELVRLGWLCSDCKVCSSSTSPPLSPAY